MVFYRRNHLAGASYFFTVCLSRELRNRQSSLLIEHIDELRHVFRQVKQQSPFMIDAMVVLPDHLHAVLTLPRNDADFPARWKAIKSQFTRALVGKGVPLIRNARGEYNVWQRRYWEHTIRNDRDLVHHVDYIHINPLNHGLVSAVADWPYSSFHRYVKAGVLPIDWASATQYSESGYGE